MLTIKTRRRDGDQRGIQALTDQGTDDMTVKLFRIKHLQIKSDIEGRQFWISQSHKHESVGEIIEYYKGARRTNIQ